MRHGSPNLSLVKEGNKIIAHNYGYGGSGWTLGPGSANYVNALLINSKYAMDLPNKAKPIAIIGASIKPYWCDTVALPAGGTSIEPKSITFRMRFDDFIGPFIMHCQMLQHSDLGMIQRVAVLTQ